LQTDKTILAVGETPVDNKQRAYVARLTLKGTLDSTFGVNGVTLIPDYEDYSHKNVDVTASASLFPNSAKDYIIIKGLKENETANISITDGSGNVKMRGESKGSNPYRLLLNNMLPGTYYVNITRGSKTEVIPFIKE